MKLTIPEEPKTQQTAPDEEPKIQQPAPFWARGVWKHQRNSVSVHAAGHTKSPRWRTKRKKRRLASKKSRKINRSGR